MQPEEFQDDFSDDQGRPLWDEIQKAMLKLVIQSRVKENNARQSPEAVVQSAIKTSLVHAEKFGIKEGDPAFYALLLASLDRKIDTAKHVYRTGLGKTAKFSALGGNDFAFLIEFETKNYDSKRGRLASPSTDKSVENNADDRDGTPTTSKTDEADEAAVVERLASRFNKWISECIGELDETTRKIAFLWSQTYTIDEIAEEMAMSRTEVEKARDVIRQKFLRSKEDI